VVSSKQRQRQLARAKWERQQERRTKDARRQRTMSWVVGVILGLVVVGGIGWLVLHIVKEENSRDQTPSVPTDSFSTNLLTPTSPVDTTSPSGRPSPSDNTKSGPTTPTGSGSTKTGSKQ
jgi:peptidyl-prolyl cis-trans isomerase B (cyclophilin B)